MWKRNLLGQSLVVALVVLATVKPALSTVITYSFEGEVTANIGSPFGLSPLTGDPTTGSFSFDTDTVGVPQGVAMLYQQTIVGGLSIHVGGSLIEADSYSVTVVNGPNDVFAVAGEAGAFRIDGVDAPDLAGRILLFDSTATAFSSDALPTSLALAAFDLAVGNLNDFATGANNEIQFDVTALTVPEPSTFTVLGMGLAGLLLCRRRIAA